MRELEPEELEQVSGAGGSYGGHDRCGCPSKKKRKKRRKGNNGFGNGGDDGSPNGFQDETR